MSIVYFKNNYKELHISSYFSNIPENKGVLLLDSCGVSGGASAYSLESQWIHLQFRSFISQETIVSHKNAMFLLGIFSLLLLE